MIITIPGKPIPLKRHRHSHNKTYDPQKKEKLAYGLLIKKAFNQEPLHGPLALNLYFSFKAPKKTPKKQSLPFPHHKRPDLDNLIKFILDASNTILYHDDSQIVSITALKVYDKIDQTVIQLLGVNTNGKKEIKCH